MNCKYLVKIEGCAADLWDEDSEFDHLTCDADELSKAATESAAQEWRYDKDLLAGYIWEDEPIYGVVSYIGPPKIECFKNMEVLSTFEVNTVRELTPEEETALKAHISGQCSDGWGEGFAQHEVKLSDGSEWLIYPWVFKAKITLEKQ